MMEGAIKVSEAYPCRNKFIACHMANSELKHLLELRLQLPEISVVVFRKTWVFSVLLLPL